ncbi:histidine acid phosphatase family protein [Stylonychia lemnae]|uniref:Histidine acid phosphatase family protein n=1 Tax=Stylonychia lemnae TaxID=5949 RepID=A0A078BA10_STYLE|nr:histidine acid phosphatase family protein [Stylonychia lemnae]|eukprot:CDW91345.1 histidine acid phosphatase family protein [Stylonychia lemnae]
MSQILDGSELQLPVQSPLQKLMSQVTTKHVLSPNPSTPLHHPEKGKEKILMSGIERLLNRKVEFVGARTIKQIQCKSETVNMLNRIGLPLAKKIKKEKSIKLRRELKLSIERETQQLLECSHPEKASTLLQTFYEQEKREIELRKEMLKKRLEASINVVEITSKRRETRAHIPDVKDYQDMTLEDNKVPSQQKKLLNDSNNFKSIQIETLNHNDSGVFKRQAMTAQNSARERTELSTQMKRSIFQGTQSLESSKSKFYEQKQQEQISEFIDSNIMGNKPSKVKTSLYTNIIRNMATSSQSTAAASINKGPSQLKKIKEERTPSQLQKSSSSIQEQQRSLTIHPVAIRNSSKRSFRGPLIPQNKDISSYNLNHSQSKNITDSQTFQSEEKISDFNSQSPKKGVRFHDKQPNSKNFSGAMSNASAHITHNNVKGEYQFRDISVLLKKNFGPRLGNTRDGTAQEIKLARFMTPKKNVLINNLATFEGKAYDEIFVVVDQYQRILDEINNIKMHLAKRPQGNSQAQMDFKKQQLYQSWLNAIEVCQENGDFTLIFYSYKFAGEIYLEFKDFQGAIKQFRHLKNLCDEKLKYREKIYAFEQIGVCYRLIEDYNQAIKFFRKQLELSWEQNDERSEISACDQLAVTYFYLGDMEKAHHFNDRMMRGKLENDLSVIKRVSKNLIISKRKRPKYEFYLNPDQLNDYLNRKQEQLSGKNQVTVDFGLSKAYQLLPHFTTKEDEDLLSNDDDYVEYGEDGTAITKKKEKPKIQSETFIVNGPKFITEDLVYLNDPPPYPYLPVTDPLLKKQKIYKRPTTQSKKQNSKNFSIRDYIGAEMFKYDLAPRNSHSAQRPKLDGHQIFHNIIERVKQTDGGNNNLNMNQRGQSTVNHLSLLRTMAKNQILYTFTVEALEKSLDVFKSNILKRQMLMFLRKWKLGVEYEEICYNHNFNAKIVSLIRQQQITSKNSRPITQVKFSDRKFYGYENELTYFDFFLKKKREENQEQEIRFSDSYGNSNTPLIITGDEGSGKSSLVIQWLKQLTNPLKVAVGQPHPNKNHVIIYHFAGVSNCDLKYQSFIFRTLVKLRQEYDIQHRVEIIDDKLRMNFARWLELASQKHEERLDPDSKIILILDGLENFHDVDTQGEESADWIPWTFPNHIKVILMTRKNSKAMNHFKLRKYPIIYMNGVSTQEISSMIEDYARSDSGKQISTRLLDQVKQELIFKVGLSHQESFINPDELKELQSLSYIPPSPGTNEVSSYSLMENKVKKPAFTLFQGLQAMNQMNPKQNSYDPSMIKNQSMTIATNVNQANQNTVFQIPSSLPELKSMIQDPFNSKSNPLVVKGILNFCLLYNKYQSRDDELFKVVPLDPRQVLESRSLKQMFITAINHFRLYLFTISSNNTAEEQYKFDTLIGYIYVSRKGVTEKELFELIPSLSDQQFQRFMSVFGFALVKEQEQIFIKHSSFKKAVRESVQLIKNEDQKIVLHRNLSTVIEKETFSLRQIDELSHQYFMGKCWIKLKDLISNIEVFSIMFVPEIKHELASYWQCLEQHKYDPVAEYNKALEGFVVKYRPNNQELFVILIQLSRFFKELADLETKYTPQFKHPPLRGQSELESITLLGELQKLDDLYNPHANSTAVSSIVNEPLLGDVEHFNVDNTIVREQIMNKIKKELEDSKNEKAKDNLNNKNGGTSSQIYYYYKRWIWVQFPWCTIDVYSNLSNIMEMSMGSHTNYISTAKENELVNGTIQILKEAKLRKKNNRAALNQSSANASQGKSSKNTRSLSPSRNTNKNKLNLSAATPMKMELRNNLVRKQTQNLGGNTQNNGSTLPPIAPQSAKNAQQSFPYQSRFSKNQSFKVGYRSTSAGGPLKDPMSKSMNHRNLLSLSLDSEDKKSPEKMLTKLTDKINLIEKQELLNLEQQNMGMGSDLNQITFQILRKEKELRYLQELYETLQTEENLNQQEKVKLETTEAKLLKAYENLNRVEVEKKRLEQIFTVCQRNPAKNQEWIRNLESQVESMRKLVRYQELQIQQYKTECEDNSRQMIEVQQQMEEKRKLREQAIYKVTNIIEKKRQLDIRVAEVEEQRTQILKGMEGPEKIINKLKQRQVVYRKWIAKLQVTKAFVNEKKNYYERAFRKITAVTGISNPNDIEGLLGFIERTNDLRKTKQTRERKVDQMKLEKLRLEDELRNIQNGQPQYDHTDIEQLQNKQQEKDKGLRDLKDLTQRTLFQIADMKSGIVNVAKKLGLKGVEIDKQNMSDYIEKIHERYNAIMRSVQIKQQRMDFTMIIEEAEANQSQRDNDHERRSGTESANLMRQDSKQVTDLVTNMNDDKVSAVNNLSSQAETPIRQRKRQPKQTKALTQSDQSANNQNQENQNNLNTTINQIHQLHSRGEKNEDSEIEERNQMKHDRMKVKELLGMLKTRNSSSGALALLASSSTQKLRLKSPRQVSQSIDSDSLNLSALPAPGGKRISKLVSQNLNKIIFHQIGQNQDKLQNISIIDKKPPTSSMQSSIQKAKNLIKSVKILKQQ